MVHPRRSDAVQDLSLPGNIQAFVETPIYARTNGYLKKWYVDIGGKVKAGDLLASIDTPEVDQQLAQAEAAQLQAQANLDLAKTTADRWHTLLKSDGVSQQEVDQNDAALKARQADLNAAAANVRAPEGRAILPERHRAIFRHSHRAKRRYRRADLQRHLAGAVPAGADRCPARLRECAGVLYARTFAPASKPI